MLKPPSLGTLSLTQVGKCRSIRHPGQLAKETADNQRRRWMIQVPKIAGKPAGADSVMDALAFGDCPWQKWPRMHLGTHALVSSYMWKETWTPFFP